MNASPYVLLYTLISPSFAFSISFINFESYILSECVPFSPTKRYKMSIRRIIFALLALVAFLPSAEAQLKEYDKLYFGLDRPRKRVEMGVLGSASMLFQSAEGVDISAKMGFRVGVVMAFCWDEQFAVQGEIGYLHHKSDVKTAAATYSLSSNVCEVPLLFSYRGIPHLRLNVGPVINLASSAHYESGGERIEAGSLRSTVGYAAGVAVEITRHLIIDARYTGNFRQSFNYAGGKEFNMRSHWATLTLGYVF